MDLQTKDAMDYALLGYLDLKERGERARKNTAAIIRVLRRTRIKTQAIFDVIHANHARIAPPALLN